MDGILTWFIEEHVLLLTLPKYLTHEALGKVNRDINQILDKSTKKKFVYLNAVDLSLSHQNMDMFRDSLTFMNNRNLDCILITAGNKLNRLILLMAFSTALVPVMQFDNMRGVNEYLQRRGITLPDTKCG